MACWTSLRSKRMAGASYRSVAHSSALTAVLLRLVQSPVQTAGASWNFDYVK